jgi:subtilisin
VKVAIVDTGIDCAHPDLPSPGPPFYELDGFNALPGGGSYCDNHGHGTHIAGIIAARVNNNGLAGIIGAAPRASLVAVKVLNINGDGYLSDLINGLQWIWSYNNQYQNQIQNQIRLVNMSLGFSADSPPLEAAIEKLSDDHPGTFMVAAAGNSCAGSGGQDEAGGDEGQGACNTTQTDTLLYPAEYPVVIAVTATNSQDQITYYSLEGLAVAVTAPGGELDVTAPGGAQNGKRILSTLPIIRGGPYGYGSGTSQAAAHVTGALALKLQQQPALSLQDVPQLLQTATPVPGNPPPKQRGAGLINAETLLAAP